MIMFVKKQSEVPFIEATADGAKGAGLRWLLGPEDNMPNFHLRVVEVEPGGMTMHHQHNYEHECFILEGQGKLVGNDNELQLEPGNAAYVPANEIHQFKNVGENTFKFLCIIPSDYKEREAETTK
jgi:quercetin dioxygenase-like cupin family protein